MVEKSVDEQLEILLRGTFFPDETVGTDAVTAESLDALSAAPSDSEAPRATGTDGSAAEDGPRSAADKDGPGTGLRAQMTRELRKRLGEGRPLRVYIGVDPTATSLHIGHLVPVQKLRVFQELGHHVIFLIGDYTGLIGDPTGQSSERKSFTHDELRAMAEDYAAQAFQLLDESRTEVRFNSEWLSKLQFPDLIELASIFPLKWVVSRHDFKARLDKGESLRLHETLYCLMQGYDAHALDCDVQVGGYDQYLNMLAGRWIQEHFGKKPHIPWTVPLLMGTDGRKMSKSFGNAINVRDTSEDMFGKSMRISDDLLTSYIDLTTNFTAQEADALQAELLQPGMNPMEIKKRVAFNITQQYHGSEAAERAAEQFQQVIQGKGMPDDVEIIPVPDLAKGGGMSWPDLLTELSLAKSKGEVRRLMSQGGFYVEGEAITDVNATFDPLPLTVIRLGKRRWYKLKI